MAIEILNNKLNHMIMEKYYELYHVYEDDKLDDVVKLIGIFNTPKEAWEVVKSLRHKPGFRKYSQKCFWISRCYIDLAGWDEGFTIIIS